MRRSEFQVESDEAIQEFLSEMTFGFATSVTDEGYPVAKPINFVYLDGNIYFHGSRRGDKVPEFGGGRPVSFTVAKEFALIPSYFTDKEKACPATAFFKSVILFGRGYILNKEERERKAEVLTAFMEKLQPEGGYEKITAESYRGDLNAVNVFELRVEQLTAKFKFGQNLKEKKWQSVHDGLSERGKAGDMETAGEMLKSCPFHSKAAGP